MGRHMLTIRLLVDSGFEVVAVDHQGHGLSSGSVAFNVSHVIDDVADIIRTHQTTSKGARDRPQFIVAHSMGGLIGLSAALRDATKKQLRLDGIAVTGPLLYTDPAIATPFLVAASGVLGTYLPMLPVVAPVTEKIWHDTAVQRAVSRDERACSIISQAYAVR